MKSLVVRSATTAALWAVFLCPALAQVCADRDLLLTRLAVKHSEKVVAVGVDTGGTLIELAASRDGTTWTLIQTFPNGVSCFVAAGEDWQSIPPEEEGRKS